MSDVKWWKIRDQSLALAAREAGFDISVYDFYSDAVKTELKAQAVFNVMRNIRNSFSEATDKELSSVKQGVYVICLSQPFDLNYESGCSSVIYIGRGSINNRLKRHFEYSLFRFMKSLAGTNFDFYLTEPINSESDSYYKHIEFLMIKRFREKFGEYPILNKNAGSDQKLTRVGRGWDLPLKNTGKKPLWSVRPTVHWDFEKLE